MTFDREQGEHLFDGRVTSTRSAGWRHQRLAPRDPPCYPALWLMGGISLRGRAAHVNEAPKPAPRGIRLCARAPHLRDIEALDRKGLRTARRARHVGTVFGEPPWDRRNRAKSVQQERDG